MTVTALYANSTARTMFRYRKYPTSPKAVLMAVFIEVSQ